MDPLAKELACACVRATRQRDYRKLAARLETALKQRVSIEFSDDLAESMAGVSPTRESNRRGRPIVGGARREKGGSAMSSVCELTDPDGNTTLTALFVARSDDPARELKDIGGRKMFFGLADGDETCRQPGDPARRWRRACPARPAEALFISVTRRSTCSIVSTPPPVAVIPGYALALLEGCGSVKPGSLKVIGKTQPVPFIAVFVADTIPAERQENFSKRCWTSMATQSC